MACSLGAYCRRNDARRGGSLVMGGFVLRVPSTSGWKGNSGDERLKCFAILGRMITE